MRIDYQKLNGYTVVKANTIAAASGFVSTQTSRPVLNCLFVEVTDEGVTVTATDSYKLCHFRSKDFKVEGTNPKGATFLLPWAPIKTAKMISTSPKKSLWLAMKQEGQVIELMLIDDSCTIGYEIVAQLSVSAFEGRFPNYRQLDNRKQYGKNPRESGVKKDVVFDYESPCLNTNYVIDVLTAFKKGVSDDGACVTRFLHRGLLEPIHFMASNKAGEEGWAMVMPVRNQ